MPPRKAAYVPGVGKKLPRGGPNAFRVPIGNTAVHGWFISCVRGKERASAREVMDALRVYIGPLDSGKADAAGEDKMEATGIEDDVERELRELRESADVRVGASARPSTTVAGHMSTSESSGECLAFVRMYTDSSVATPDPAQVLYQYFHDLATPEPTAGVIQLRYTSRIVPVQGTCAAKVDDVCALAKMLIEKHFPKDKDGVYLPIKFCVAARTRFNDSITTKDITHAIAALVDPAVHTVSLTAPDMVVIVEAVKFTCCVSVVQKYMEHAKFNVEMVQQQAAKRRCLDTKSGEQG